MRARAQPVGWIVAVALAATTAGADPKPEPVDVKAYRDKLVLLQDASGGTYAVYTERGKDAHVFYGTGKALYEQYVPSRGFDEDRWSVALWAPRVARVQNASIVYKQDHTYALFCGSEETGLTQLTGDKASRVLARSSFLSAALVRRAHLLARDDAGVYYFIDVLRDKYGGKGYRLFVGKKGAMKQVPITDIASDTGGEVFSTKSGDLRLVTSNVDEHARSGATWIKGDKRTQLVALDVDMNSPVIYRDLGIYTFIGTVCENL
ncbi:MAG: hypothetical protein ACM31C_14225 [Acidobacteriota bacterium]